jgi:hypothetical protein
MLRSFGLILWIAEGAKERRVRREDVCREKVMRAVEKAPSLFGRINHVPHGNAEAIHGTQLILGFARKTLRPPRFSASSAFQKDAYPAPEASVISRRCRQIPMKGYAIDINSISMAADIVPCSAR